MYYKRISYDTFPLFRKRRFVSPIPPSDDACTNWRPQGYPTTLVEVEMVVGKHQATNQDRLTGGNLKGNEERRWGHRNDFRKGYTVRRASLLFFFCLFCCFSIHTFSRYIQNFADL